MKKLFTLFFINCCFWGYCQENVRDKHIDFAFSPGIIQQRNTFVEANLFIGKIIAEMDHPKAPPIVGVSGVRIGVESDFNKTIAPKIGYEFALIAVTLRLSALNYFQGSNSQFRILPEIGFCAGGWVNLTYGYGFSFNDGGITDIGHHRVSLSFNFNRKLGDATSELFLKAKPKAL